MHEYYYQVQGQLNVCGFQKCYFMAATDSNSPLFVEEIQRHENFWKAKMVPKLTRFYMECLLPEIADPRIPRRLPVESDFIVQTQNSNAKEKIKRSPN